LSEEDLFFEKIFLSLRSNIGLELANLPLGMMEKIEILLRGKKGFIKDERFYNSNFFLADEIALFLNP
ncbi:MAG: hypothetical protein LBH45_05710, partial [Campylobacteraceae bacterium]|jgi:oxygen-independent coproporphyrinogen-3 oxidase|nr:hypothetical protein [Campylobacteraceae bacterium]